MRYHPDRPMIALLLLTVAAAPALAADAPPTRDVVFATTEQGPLKLNLFMPKGVEKPPLVIYIHGGGWHAGSYANTPRASWLVDQGFALASIGYRLSDKAKFPAQVHDCFAAVRWLRAHADDYGYDPDRIAVCGASAGGYLALMVGLASDNKQLTGDVGDHDDVSNRVTCIVDYYGASDFVLRSQNQPSKTDKPGGSVFGLLGKPASSDLELARLASPVTHVDAKDPPLLIVHGTKDGTVKPDQAEAIEKTYKAHELDVTLDWVEGGGHGDPKCFEGDHRKRVIAFLKKHLKSESK